MKPRPSTISIPLLVALFLSPAFADDQASIVVEDGVVEIRDGKGNEVVNRGENDNRIRGKKAESDRKRRGAPRVITVAKGGEKRCEAEDQCKLACPAGHCRFHCEAGSRCNVSCLGGDCHQICEKGATCRFTCKGGECTQTIRAHAKAKVSCIGGDCARVVAKSAKCNLSCLGGDCSTKRTDR